MPRPTNQKLIEAQADPDDEFYTPREMIEAELKHYSESLFHGKRILCNCDDPDHSEFFKYFADNFTALKLKRLVGLRYSGSSLRYKNLGKDAERYQVPADKSTPPYKLELSVDKNGKKYSTGKRLLPGGDTGGFNDREGNLQLKKCDIVVTNPPFSKWREFIEMLAKSKKKFIVIGNLGAVGFDSVFPLIKNGKIWLGAGPRTKGAFIRPNMIKTTLAPAYWYTNLPHKRRERKNIPLVAEYSAREYPTYDNYPAIEVGKVKNIPADYHGEMGVPITFLEKHNPHQFEIVGRDIDLLPGQGDRFYIKGRRGYVRLVIRRAGAVADWKETKDLTRNSIFGNAGGFVYIAVIPGDTGWFKIGKTNTSVADRVKRDAFSRKTPKVVMALEVANAGMAERQIHDSLREYRKGRTEFFNPPRKYLEEQLFRLAQKTIRLWM